MVMLAPQVILFNNRIKRLGSLYTLLTHQVSQACQVPASRHVAGSRTASHVTLLSPPATPAQAADPVTLGEAKGLLPTISSASRRHRRAAHVNLCSSASNPQPKRHSAGLPSCPDHGI